MTRGVTFQQESIFTNTSLPLPRTNYSVVTMDFKGTEDKYISRGYKRENLACVKQHSKLFTSKKSILINKEVPASRELLDHAN